MDMMMMKTETYKGFGIIPDELLGYSGIDRQGKWMLSNSNKKVIKSTIDNIIKYEENESK